MNHTDRVDQDAVLRARTMLLGSGRLSLGQQVEAYRVLSVVSPLTYLPKLTEALLSCGYAPEIRDRPEVQLARHAEAAATARRIDAGEPNRTELLVRALSAYRYELYSVGRRAEGFAICEEMAEAGRWGFAHGQVPSPIYGHGPLATVLAEDGHHREAAELCGEFVQAARSEDSAKVSFWTMVEWAAELDAAGSHDAALEAFAELVDAERADVDEGSSSLAILTWLLVHQAGMLDAAGRHVEGGRARRDALALLSEMDETGERKSWSNILTWWTTLYALSGRTAETAPNPSALSASIRLPVPRLVARHQAGVLRRPACPRGTGRQSERGGRDKPARTPSRIGNPAPKTCHPFGSLLGESQSPYPQATPPALQRRRGARAPLGRRCRRGAEPGDAGTVPDRPFHVPRRRQSVRRGL